MRNAWCTHTSFCSRPPGARLHCDTHMKPFRHPLTLIQIDHTSFCQAYTHARPFTRDTRVAVVRHVTQSLWLLEIQFAFSMVATHARDTSLNFFCLVFSFFFLSIYFVCVCVCIFHSFNCKCIVLLIFLVILRFLWDFRTGIDVIVLFSRNEGDIKDTLLIERV